MQKDVLFFLLIIFVSNLIASGFSEHTFGCSDNEIPLLKFSTSEDQKPALLNEKSSDLIASGLFSAAHGHSDCNCPVHRAHSCNQLTLTDKAGNITLLGMELKNIFNGSVCKNTSEPYLDGPFFPPKHG